ncbi:hypothetical protein LTR66_003202 [Elasticomyces elasticus]|nr:hypothetical protein LTR66_003202 [Elasticomyces elasticus]
MGGDANPHSGFIQNVRYSDESPLNTLDLYIPDAAAARDRRRVWVVYIHGGAWRDPAIDASTFTHTRNTLLDAGCAKQIAGYASLNYRLSPYPAHPTDPSNPSDPSRNAKHPDHINDILAALLYLQEAYQFEDRYVLAGHSCGATLAFQVAAKRYWGSQYEATFALELNVVPPLAILGLEGLYDLPALVKYHDREPIYAQIVGNAFGSAASWQAVSPASADYKDSWQEGTLVVLAHSKEDELVEWQQVELMEAALMGQGWQKHDDAQRRVRVMELRGTHDGVWKENTEIARALEWTLQQIIGHL